MHPQPKNQVSFWYSILYIYTISSNFWNAESLFFILFFCAGNISLIWMQSNIVDANLSSELCKISHCKAVAVSAPLFKDPNLKFSSGNLSGSCRYFFSSVHNFPPQCCSKYFPYTPQSLYSKDLVSFNFHPKNPWGNEQEFRDFFL